MKQPLIILAGSTAAGKTEISIRLAKAVGGEIISADSMQVYRHMDIGSAKIKPHEMRGIPHHLVDILEPEEEFHVALFQKLAKEAIAKICENGRIPILVGGTGFYIQALVYDIDFRKGAAVQNQSEDYRNRLQILAAQKGPGYLHAMLEQTDKKAAQSIHENNVKRVIRALEFFHQTGEPISEHNERERQKNSPYNSAYFVLNDDRERLYERIDSRVDKMLAEGLVEEVLALRNRGVKRGMVSMQGLGYKEILAFLEGEISLEEAVLQIKRDTRHFAKRQITWFKREKDVIWLNRQDFCGEPDGLILRMEDELNKRGIQG